MVKPADGIVIQGLGFRIGNFNLTNLSCTIRNGEYFVMTGPNGAGKSVLIKLIAGLYRPHCGNILIHGTDMTSEPPWRRNIGYVPQEGFLFPHRTVRGNVMFSLEVRGMDKKKRNRKADEMLEMLGMAAFADRYPAGLSGGERQKVGIARALVFRPAVLLLDEPVSAIDETARDAICGEIKRLQQALGVTTIHVSHNSRETALVADRVGVLREGGVSVMKPRSHEVESPGRTNQNAETEPQSTIFLLFKGLSNLLESIFRGSKWLLRGCLEGNSRAVRPVRYLFGSLATPVSFGIPLAHRTLLVA